GSLEFLSPENPRVLAYVRRFEDECLLVVANLSRFRQFVELDLGAFQGLVPVELMGRSKFPSVAAQPYFLTLGPHDFFWFSLEPRRDAVPAPPAADWPTLRASHVWEEIVRGRERASLEEALPVYLERCPWFHGKG